MDIQKTTDYDRFKTIKGNRILYLRHLKNLTNSILKNNLLHANPIIVNEKDEVIDGQHRLQIARECKLPIYYTRVNGMSALPEVQMLNANSKTWSMQDYLLCQIQLGNKDYQILKDFSELYDLPLSVSMYLLGGYSTSTRSKSYLIIQNFKEGKFQIKKMKDAMELAEKLNLVKPYVDGVIWRDREFLRALQQAFKQVGSKRFIKKLFSAGIKVRRQMGVKEYLRVLEDIFNRGLHEEHRIRFF